MFRTESIVDVEVPKTFAVYCKWGGRNKKHAGIFPYDYGTILHNMSNVNHI